MLYVENLRLALVWGFIICFMKAIIFPALLLINLTCAAQTAKKAHFYCLPCSDIKIYKLIHDAGKVPEEDMYCFIRSWGLEVCRNNVEYSEEANEILFDLLRNRPAEVIEILETYPGLNNKYLYQEVQSPLTDDYDLKEVFAAIDSVKSSSSAKMKLLLAVKIAEARNN